MKLFCAYAFTGENLGVVTNRMKLIVNALNAQGHEAYCNRFDPIVDEIQKNDDIQAIFRRAFDVIKQHEVVFAIIITINRDMALNTESGNVLATLISYLELQ